jgi:hypothetical protein
MPETDYDDDSDMFITSPHTDGGRRRIRMQSREIPVRPTAKWVGRAAIAITATALLAPQAKDIWEHRQGWLGLGLAGTGALWWGSDKDRRRLGTSQHNFELSGKLLTAGSVALAVTGGALLVQEGWNATLGKDGNKNESASSEPSGDPKGDNEQELNPTTTLASITGEAGVSCELILDFNNVPQDVKDSGRYTLDAQRLQYRAYEAGGYAQFGATGDFTDIAKFVDAELGDQTSAAVAHYRGTLGLEPSTPSWGAEMCAADTELSDGDPNTPSFEHMPELKFGS